MSRDTKHSFYLIEGWHRRSRRHGTFEVPGETEGEALTRASEYLMGVKVITQYWLRDGDDDVARLRWDGLEYEDEKGGDVLDPSVRDWMKMKGMLD